MTTTDRPPAAQPLIDLHRLLTAIRRRRRLWVSTGVLGLLAGAAFAFLTPQQPTAVTQLIVLHAADQPNDSKSLIQTDVAVLETSRIAGAALTALNSTASPEQFLTTYSGEGVTNNIMQVTVTAPTYRDALARAQALADAFIADHRQRLQAAADAEAQALLDQRDDLQRELNQVDVQIVEASGRNSRVGPAELQSLYAQRADLASRVSDFTGRANEARIGEPQLGAGTQIVDGPRAVGSSVLASAVTTGGIGGGFGLFAGLALAAVLGVVRDRPVLRRDISTELGASVIGELPQPRRLRHARSDTQRARVAATVARAVTAEGGPVSVLELGCPRVAATLALEVAKYLAKDTKVVLVDDLPHRDLTAVAGKAPAVPVVDGSERLDDGLRLGVGSVSPGTAWTDLRRLGAETVLVVRAGKASTLWLHTVARQLADLGIPVIGIVLVAPDPRDRTDGTLWDGLHTALRGRATFAEARRVNGSANVDDHPTTWFAPLPAAGAGERTATLQPVHAELPTTEFTPVTPAETTEAHVNGKRPLDREG
ncbi:MULTISPECIES: Wzz/FepE/Etk N-terminal domain-containing protein [Amycolatopsis]|uniref:Wzz/FepE/Etk N-terminal domain-containing protein n=1 Tax=Amycolatopsis TaxID=1813 RepID=UPI000B8AFC6E|nr:MULTISPECIES: Wzz/FepE/Etk N-terminal domain-containing protein [Amycolatopsis]OXM74141.1 polysaccharide biosynthesis protein [Amycolatopsis sp. KNN50.9b]